MASNDEQGWPTSQAQTDEELELQMALALSLQEVHASQVSDAQPSSSAPPVAAAQPSQQAQHAVPNPTNASNLGPPNTQLQDLLSQALSTAMFGNTGSIPQTAPDTSTPAVTQAAVPPPAVFSNNIPPQATAQPTNDTAAELARQFALFQQTLAAGQSSQAQSANQGRASQQTRPQSAAQSRPAQAPPPVASRPATAHPSRTGSSSTAVSRAPVIAPSMPAWAFNLKTWWSRTTDGQQAAASKPQRPTDNEIALASSDEAKQFVQQLSTVLGTKVVLAGDGDNQGLPLRTISGASGSGVVVRGVDLAGLLGSWVRRPSMMASGISQLRALHDAYDSLQSLTGLSGSLPAAISSVSAIVADMAFQLLASDEEDLYFDKGQYTGELLRDLKTPHRKGAGMCVGFMAGIASSVRDDATAAAFSKVLKAIMDDAKALKQLGRTATELEPVALSLDVATAPNTVQRCLIGLLISEAVHAGSYPSATRGASPAKSFEAASILTPLLQISSMVDPVSVLSHNVTGKAAATIKELKGFPTNEGEINTAVNVLGNLQVRLQDVIHGLLKRIVTLKEGVAPGQGREVVMTWLAAGGRLNHERTLAGERGIAAQAAQEFCAGSSDGWCINLVAVCLRFSSPFVEGYWDMKTGKFTDLFTRHLSPSYYATQSHRLPDMQQVNSMAGERGRSVADAILAVKSTDTNSTTSSSSSNNNSATPWIAASLPASNGPSFIADCFFMTQTWMHVGLMPALYKYHRMIEVLQNAMTRDGTRPSDARAANPLMTQLAVLVACQRAALLHPRFVEDSVQFCLLQIAWLHHLLRQPDASNTFMLIPDYVLSDSLSWLTFILQSGLAVHIASKDISVLTSALAALLDAPHAVRSPVLLDKMAKLLLAMLAPQLSVSKRAAMTSGGRGALAPTIQRPGEAACVAGVLNSSATQSGVLLASLMRAYVAADHVVGLDVDRDAFDKFTMRSCIDSILEELWLDERGKRSLLALATSNTQGNGHAAGRAAFDEYVSCLFNSLIYLFKDSLDRLVDISKVETAKRDEAGWAARTSDDKAKQEGFLRSQAQTCRGFMRIAVQSLGWLNNLASNPQTGAALCRPPLNGRVAFSCLHFMELLSDYKAQSLKVERPEQYHWGRVDLLSKVVSLVLMLINSGEGGSFMQAIASEPDLDMDMLARVLSQLEDAHMVQEATGLANLIKALSEKTGVSAPAVSSSPAVKALDNASKAATQPPPAKRVRTSLEDTSVASMAADVSPGRPAAGLQSTAMDVDDDLAGLQQLPGSTLSDSELATEYKSQLSELQLGTFDSDAPRAYHSAFKAMAQEIAASHAPAMMKRVAKEVRDMSSGRTSLPCEPAASIFIRYDADKMHKMRALVTGPAGTPYAYGCFVFDLLFPSGYPNTPMLVNFETTGQGRARFNPNLYADGKVCLSLINTWHASHESEKWNPDRTTTFQVLVSIQAMILVEDPYYNEPAHEAAKGTDVGQSSAAAYNAQLTLNTLRWSIIDKLKNPPPGFEDVVRQHFRLLKHKVMDTAIRWARAADAVEDEALGKRTHAAVKELHALLAAL